MKRIIAALLALTMIGAAASCGSKPNSGDTSVEVTRLSFSEAEIPLAEDFSSIMTLDCQVNGVFIFGVSTIGKWTGYVTDMTFADFDMFIFEPKDGETVKSACMGKYGKKAVVTWLDGAARVYILDGDGNVMAENDLGDLLTGEDCGAVVKAAGDGFVINVDGNSLAALDGSGNYLGDVDLKGGAVMGVSEDRDGVPTVLLGIGGELFTAPIEGTSVGELTKCTGASSSTMAMAAGKGEFTLIANFLDKLCGLREGTWHPLTDLMDNSFSANQVTGMIAAGENEYAVLVNDAQGSHLILLAENEGAEIKAKKTVTLAVHGGIDQSYIDLIKLYNKENPDSEYRYELISYGEWDENTPYSQIISNMKIDIATGNAPDIIVRYLPGIDPSVYYMDLMDFIENDPDISPEDFVPGLLEGISFKGMVPTLFPGFQVVSEIGKAKFLSGKENWDYDQYIETIENLPEGMSLYPGDTNCAPKIDVFKGLCDIYEFVDYEHGTCDFDAPEFVKMLKFVKDSGLGMTDQEFEDYLRSFEGVVQYDKRDPFAYRDDKALLGSQYHSMSNPTSMVSIIHGEYNEPVTFVGNPTRDGHGGRINNDQAMQFSIMRNAKCPEGAWELIKFACFSGENEFSRYNFPLLKEDFDRAFEDTLTMTWTDPETGEEHPGGWLFYTEGAGEPHYLYYDPLSREEMEQCRDYVLSCVTRFRRYDEDLMKVVDEELTEYFATDRTAESTAEMLQNRLSIYMSEKYG